jgi:hypothetical protein
MMRVILLTLLSCLGSSLIVGAVRFMTSEEAPVAPAVRIAVLKEDHVDGAPLTVDEIGEAMVPGDLISPAWLSPEAVAANVGKPCLVGLKGAALTAAHFADLTVSKRKSACTEAIAPEVNAAADAEVDKVFAAFQRREEPAREKPKGRVLYVVHDLHEGDVLKAGDLREGDAPPEFVTSSWIPAERAQELIGQQVLAELEKDTPLWWQMLNTPGTPGNCEFEASRASDAVKKTTAQRAATAWVEKESASW